MIDDNLAHIESAAPRVDEDDIRLDGPTLRFCIRLLEARASGASTSDRSPVERALSAAAEELRHIMRATK